MPQKVQERNADRGIVASKAKRKVHSGMDGKYRSMCVGEDYHTYLHKRSTNDKDKLKPSPRLMFVHSKHRMKRGGEGETMTNSYVICCAHRLPCSMDRD